MPNIDIDFHHYTPALQVLAGVSLLIFAAGLAILPWMVSLLPRDYFKPPKPQMPNSRRQLTVMGLLRAVLRNLIGVVLLVAGIAMLFLPGQGILTIIVAVAIMDIPGKRRLIARLTSPPRVRRGLDWLRKKAGKDAFFW